MSRVSAASARARQTSPPSIVGMSMSQTITSGRSRRATLRAWVESLSATTSKVAPSLSCR